MTEIASWGVIGRGTIGSEVIRQIGNVPDRLQLEPLPHFVLSDKLGKLIPARNNAGVPQYDKTGQLVLEETGETWKDVVETGIADVLFVAMPSSDDGVQAHKYISDALADNVDVITAEKGALANFFGQLREASVGFSNLGYNASVGGGTAMLRHLQERCIDPVNVQEIHLAVNGTLTYIYSGIGPLAGRGRARGEVVYEAKDLGYAEPDKPGQVTTDFDVIRGEAVGDIPKKAAILFNSLGMSTELLDYKDLNFVLTDADIRRSIQEAKVRRMIVSILPKNSDVDHDDVIGRYEYEHDGWKIIMGFPHIDRNPLYDDLAQLTGAGNGFVIGEGPGNTDGTYTHTGPGAGRRPTVGTMLNDRLRMLRARQPITHFSAAQARANRDWITGSRKPLAARPHRHRRSATIPPQD